VSVTGCTGAATACTGSVTVSSVSVTGCTGSVIVCTGSLTLCSVSVTGCTESVAGSVASVPSVRPPVVASMLWVVLEAASVVDAAVPSTDPRLSAGDVDPEPSTTLSLPGAGSLAVDVVGSVAVASPDDAEASAGAAASFEEGVASVLVIDEAGSVATAVGSEAVVSGWSTLGAASVADVVGSVVELAVVLAVSEVSCVVVLAASTVVSVLTGAAAGSISTVGSLKV
jgi:hypothetical protein